MKLLNTILTLGFYTLAYTKCCEKCPEGTTKYYSIDRKNIRCSEYCMDPEMYTTFKRYDSGLQRAWWSHPCFSYGYVNYETTKTLGSSQMSIKLDKYKRAY